MIFQNKKKIITVMSLVLFTIISIALMNPFDSYASTKTLVYEQSKTTESFAVNTFNFKVSNTSDVEINVYVPAPTGVTFTVHDSKGKICGNPQTISNYNSSWVLDGKGWYTNKFVIDQLKAGKYSVDYVFDESVTFDAKIVQLSAAASFENENITLTAGFKKNLQINNATAKSWSSSNKSVATVSKKGVVTAKKTGNAVITAKLDNGKSIKCKIKVQSNKYSVSKISSSYVGINDYAIKAHYAAYKSDGSLVIKFRIVNETNRKIDTIPKFRVTVTNLKNNSVASYSKNTFKVNVPAHSSKDYSITIEKNAVLDANADLRNSIINIESERVPL